VTALARELIEFLSGAAAPQPALNQSPVAQTQTLEELVRGLSALGIRRAILLSLQLATELDLASASGFGLGAITLRTVRIERPGTPFEQALLPRGAADAAREDTSAESLRELGVILSELLSHKPVYLEDSLLYAAPPPLPRRADRDVLHALRRALALIAEHCQPGSARYTNAFDVAGDLSRLANIATHIVQSKQAPPIVVVHRPKPRRRSARRRLPKVVVHERSVR
jgi:hypothetical protein